MQSSIFRTLKKWVGIYLLVSLVALVFLSILEGLATQTPDAQSDSDVKTKQTASSDDSTPATTSAPTAKSVPAQGSGLVLTDTSKPYDYIDGYGDYAAGKRYDRQRQDHALVIRNIRTGTESLPLWLSQLPPRPVTLDKMVMLAEGTLLVLMKNGELESVTNDRYLGFVSANGTLTWLIASGRVESSAPEAIEATGDGRAFVRHRDGSISVLDNEGRFSTLRTTKGDDIAHHSVVNYQTKKHFALTNQRLVPFQFGSFIAGPGLRRVTISSERLSDGIRSELAYFNGVGSTPLSGAEYSFGDKEWRDWERSVVFGPASQLAWVEGYPKGHPQCQQYKFRCLVLHYYDGETVFTLDSDDRKITLLGLQQGYVYYRPHNDRPSRIRTGTGREKAKQEIKLWFGTALVFPSEQILIPHWQGAQ